jgi:hypothetical protein
MKGISKRALYLSVVSALYVMSYVILKQFIVSPHLINACQLGYVVSIALPLMVPSFGRLVGFK